MRHNRDEERIKQSVKTIGIFDSGIGGLSVLAEILKNFPGNAAYYFADNLSAPFGNLSDEKLADRVAEGLAQLQTKSDVCVIACNTASTFLKQLSTGTKYEDKSHNEVFILRNIQDKPHFKPIYGILPPVDFNDAAHPLCSFEPSKTLLMATAGTRRRARVPEGLRIAETDDLATLIEQKAEGSNMDELTPYLQQKLSGFEGVKNVILGCTHYPFCKKQIAATLGRVKFFDGSGALIAAMREDLSPALGLPSPITFEFSGKDESEKYSRIVENLVNGSLS